MSKKTILASTLVLLVFIGFILYRTYFFYPDLEEVLTQEEFVKTFEDSEALKHVDGLERVGVNGNSTEETILDVMHQMTHQKVVASQKWGAVPMTTRNIEQMSSIVSNSDKIRTAEAQKQLLQIIAKWERGDFSEADEDHNYIWNLQDGTLGKAKGLLSKEAELQFIEESFLEADEEP